MLKTNLTLLVLMEPSGLVCCVVGVDDLASFYQQAYPRLVGQLRLFCGRESVAEELVQDAFVRLVPRWSSVRAYENPEAWVRRVAMRLAVNRWKRERIANAALPQLWSRQQGESELDGDHVDLVRALARVSVKQRQVLLLHYVADQSIHDISAELGVPVGTIKTRLMRGRQALEPLLTRERNAS